MKSHQGSMSSLADMPKQVILLEIFGIVCLILAYLTINDIVILTDLLMTPEAHVVMIFIGVGCLVPAAVNIIWRAVCGLSFLGVDHKKESKNKVEGSDNGK
ncbi:YbjC family protein [Photorhabdus antumapuensis]|uniref:YbjC family protein n=1 Tax=Photorhabdus antumapuensis TaxID=2862867 RepID=UPI001CEDBE97|nr:YbjC family protein [Photorhabdus antumapuensis]MCA6220208.1 YbjC family protein [Photorhabdus antumapuensis]